MIIKDISSNIEKKYIIKHNKKIFNQLMKSNCKNKSNHAILSLKAQKMTNIIKKMFTLKTFLDKIPELRHTFSI